MALGNWPEHECPVCHEMIPTFRKSLPDDDADGAWDAKTETIHHYATGTLHVCHHSPGDKGRFGWACSGSFRQVGPPLSRTASPTTEG